MLTVFLASHLSPCNITSARSEPWFLCRLYIPDDVDYIEQDLEQLKVMFLADGQGLPPQEIEDLCKPVVELLTVLQLETGILIKNFKDVSCHCCSPRVQLSDHIVSTCWRSGVGYDRPSRYLASAGTPVYYHLISAAACLLVAAGTASYTA